MNEGRGIYDMLFIAFIQLSQLLLATKTAKFEIASSLLHPKSNGSLLPCFTTTFLFALQLITC